MCSCETRTIRNVIGSRLVAGISKSCGCILREVTAKRNRALGESNRQNNVPKKIVPVNYEGQLAKVLSVLSGAGEIKSTGGWKNRSGIYAILNRISGKVYIGSAACLKGRICQHRFNLKRGTHDNSYLQRSWNTHGPDTFSFLIVEECEKSKLQEREGHWMALTGCTERAAGYNLDGIAIRKFHSEETKAKIAASHRGKPVTEAMRMNLSNMRSRRTDWTIRLTDDQRKARADKIKLQWSDPEFRAKVTRANSAPKSKEMKQKLSDFWRNRRECKGQLCLL